MVNITLQIVLIQRICFRIIQSIPSPKAEPFKQWLAQVGYERVEEIQNPELAQKRMKEIYKAKGYSDELGIFSKSNSKSLSSSLSHYPLDNLT